MNTSPLTLKDIEQAAERISPYITVTPLLRAEYLDDILAAQIYIKPEMLQLTGSFKIRGALNKALVLSPEERSNGIICSSSGNHAQACAYAGKLLNMKSVIVIPEDAPQIKINNTKRLGGDVITWERSYASRMKKVADEIAENHYTMVHGYEDYAVMAGQGTIALEILDSQTDIETVVVPLGGGGLASGVATAIKGKNKNIRVIAVQAAATCAFYVSREKGEKTRVECTPTLADGIGCSYPSDNPYPIIEEYVDEIVVVEEEDILHATKLIAKEVKLIAEPTSCVVVAALLAKKIFLKRNEKVALVLSSGNWDLNKLGQIYKGEIVEGNIAT
ncbi:threonine ammonia-lyase [Vibrio nitrifigilis]|uniref:Threonine/serine dehydratase n=1 Tax=Vibrio nitrifigilis TaxID=2789781 RepID=A0ABS0GEN6_9VIBR|nr:threonine/serine dehydratase [Vibrio nitrifigilis]MBF9000881.1 threonine/serine dehydratase [Vibrio nitrifigilis]